MTHVDCLTCREALSARMDGEDEPVPAEHTDQHLASCSACRSWQVRVEQTSRTLRVREASPVPDLSAAILDTAVPPEPARGWWARIALIVVAVAQLGLALSQLFGVGGDPHGSGHLFNESTAWNLALGVGLLWAAFRSRVTTGLIPVLAGFVLILAPYSVHDLVTGAVAGSRVAEHGLLVLALALLIVINRRYSDPAPHHGAALDDDTADTDDTLLAGTDDAGTPTTGTAGSPARRHPLRPAGRHNAA
jgi:predicted anti-sigma-YlaC factor YlaD